MRFYCAVKRGAFYFFPGGHVEFAEKAESAMVRELLEEIGETATGVNFIGVVENIFEKDDKKNHEINLLFEAKIPRTEIKSAEDEIEFCWLDTEKIKDSKIMPLVMKNCVIQWVIDKQSFWGSQDL